MSMSDAEFEAWKDDARSGDFETAIQLCGFVPKKGFERAQDRCGPCPACGGDDRFSVHMFKRMFNCRGCDAKGNNALDLALVGKHVTFITACTELSGREPPKTEARSEPRPIDREAEQMRAEAQKDRAIENEIRDKAERQRAASYSEKVFANARPIQGTIAETYFMSRSITVSPSLARWLRFVPDCAYYDGETEEETPQIIGRWPAIIALYRDANGAATGRHCTYLDPAGLRKARVVKIDEEGHEVEQAPRKTYGTIGLIWLSPIRPIMAIGEGIETTVSWHALGLGPDDIGIAAAGSLGNISGRPTGRIPHPTMKARTIPNGVPDDRYPGMPVPPSVEELLILMDHDRERANVYAHCLTAGRRHRAIGRTVSFHMPRLPDGERKWDWNDELIAQRKAEARAA